jgi:hypothetical protein
MLLGFPLWALPLTADAGGTSLDLTVFAQYGVLGIIAAILIWFARGAHQRERDRADRLEEENRRLNALILDRVIPALTSATNAVEESAELLNAIQREREYNVLADQRRPPQAKRGGT